MRALIVRAHMHAAYFLRQSMMILHLMRAFAGTRDVACMVQGEGRAMLASRDFMLGEALPTLAIIPKVPPCL